MLNSAEPFFVDPTGRAVSKSVGKAPLACDSLCRRTAASSASSYESGADSCATGAAEGPTAAAGLRVRLPGAGLFWLALFFLLGLGGVGLAAAADGVARCPGVTSPMWISSWLTLTLSPMWIDPSERAVGLLWTEGSRGEGRGEETMLSSAQTVLYVFVRLCTSVVTSSEGAS